MQAIHGRLEGFHCQTCNDSAWNGKGNVYIVALRRGEDCIYKVGLAKSVQNRLTRYGLRAEVEPAIERTQLCDTFRSAHQREQQLHAALGIAGYSVPPVKAREFLTSGFTECYSTVPSAIVESVLGLHPTRHAKAP
jgi:hypothetical protein